MPNHFADEILLKFFAWSRENWKLYRKWQINRF